MKLVKKLKFFHLLCLLKIDREKVFPHVLDRIEAFKDYKNILFMKNTKFEFLQRGYSRVFLKNWRFLQL